MPKTVCGGVRFTVNCTLETLSVREDLAINRQLDNPKPRRPGLGKSLSFAVLLVTLASGSAASAVDLSGSVWEQAADPHEIDPSLLYSVAIIESRTLSPTDTGYLHPWPYALNVDGRGEFFQSMDEAVKRLRTVQQKRPEANIDVGPMQISLQWHRHRVQSADSLLNLDTAARVGAAILAEAMASAPNDLELGVGRYHHWRDDSRARRYGARVLAVYDSINPSINKEEPWYEQ